jgi:hypothetical protein
LDENHGDGYSFETAQRWHCLTCSGHTLPHQCKTAEHLNTQMEKHKHIHSFKPLSDGKKQLIQ